MAGEGKLGHRDYARFARKDVGQLVRECSVDVFRATGPGGQGVNTTDSAVRMRHLPTGIVVTSRESRSQHQNRLRCLQKLKRELRLRAVPPKQRHATRPSHAARQRRLDEKHRRSRLKSRRRAPGTDD